jgi:uncharacterized repeat protein (TIGR02543 family)
LSGWHFTEWTVTGIAVADNTAETLSFNMPSNAVTLIANFERNPEFEITIQGGGISAGANKNPAPAGETIIINAGIPPMGHSFAGWITSDNIVLANASLPSTTFVMPAEPVTLTATWQPVFSFTPTLRVLCGFGDPGDDITVRLVLQNNPGFASMLMRVDVPAGLTLTDYALGEDFGLGDGFQAPPLGATGHFYFGWTAARATNITSRDILVSLTFSVDSDIDGRFPISVSFKNPLSDGKDIPINSAGELLNDIVIVSGAVHATDWILGDLTGTGFVTSADANALARYLAGQHVAIDLRAADFYGDNQILPRNLTRLARALVGLDPLLAF